LFLLLASNDGPNIGAVIGGAVAGLFVLLLLLLLLVYRRRNKTDPQPVNARDFWWLLEEIVECAPIDVDPSGVEKVCWCERDGWLLPTFLLLFDHELSVVHALLF
jgi:LPXTG-motif cell wall-anchored protein